MKRLSLIAIIIFTCISQKSFAQTSSKIKFKGGEMYLLSIDAQTKELIFKKPIGRVLSISYDTFYKSDSIIYNYEDKGVTVMDFEYLQDGKEGIRIFYEKESLKGKSPVVDFHIFKDDYWSYKKNVKGSLHFIGFDI